MLKKQISDVEKMENFDVVHIYLTYEYENLTEINKNI